MSKSWIPAGYMAKFVVKRPEWLKASQVVDIYSVSACSSADFMDYVNHWKHNGYWLFNRPEDILQLAKAEGINIEDLSWFYYEYYALQYDEFEQRWESFAPEDAFDTCVKEPEKSTCMGYDVVTFECQNTPECSYLSCNHMAEQLDTNAHCLFASFEAAKAAVESDVFMGCEPGPVRIVRVHQI